MATDRPDWQSASRKLWPILNHTDAFFRSGGCMSKVIEEIRITRDYLYQLHLGKSKTEEREYYESIVKAFEMRTGKPLKRITLQDAPPSHTLAT